MELAVAPPVVVVTVVVMVEEGTAAATGMTDLCRTRRLRREHKQKRMQETTSPVTMMPPMTDPTLVPRGDKKGERHFDCKPQGGSRIILK